MQNLRTALRRFPTLPSRFVVLCQPRTGSSLLNSSLRQHPDIEMHGEILNHRYPHRLPQDGYQRLRQALATTTHSAVGCNLHAFQPDRVWDGWRRWESAWRALAEDRSIKVIHLQRQDTLAQMASWKIAHLLSRWGQQGDIVDRPTIEISPDEYRWFRDWNRSVMEWRLSHLREHQILPVTYESLCADWEPTLARIQAFVGVRCLPLRQITTRNEHRPLSEVIENYDELRPYTLPEPNSVPAGYV
jgi:LPS sulfotransferase NodH